MRMAETLSQGGTDERLLTLVEIADAANVSYDRVYRDVRTGILPSHTVSMTERHDHRRFVVTPSDLAKAARPCYRRLAETFATQMWVGAGRGRG